MRKLLAIILLLTANLCFGATHLAGPSFTKTIQSAVVSITAAGDNTVVSLVAGKRIKVIAFSLQSGAADQTVRFKDGAAINLSGAFTLGLREGLALSIPSPYFLFGTTAGNALIINLGAATSVVGFVTYFTDDGS